MSGTRIHRFSSIVRELLKRNVDKFLTILKFLMTPDVCTVKNAESHVRQVDRTIKCCKMKILRTHWVRRSCKILREWDLVVGVEGKTDETLAHLEVLDLGKCGEKICKACCTKCIHT